MPKRILVIDAVATHRIRLAALLEGARYTVVAAADVEDADCRDQSYDLVVLGLSDEKPGRVVTQLSRALHDASTSILCLDARCTPLRRLHTLRAGAQDVLPSKSPDELLLARVRGLIRTSEAERECDRRRITALSFGFSDAANEFEHKAQITCVGPLGAMPEQLAALLPHRIVCRTVDEVLDEDDLAEGPDAFLLGIRADERLVEALLPDLRDRMHMRPAPVIAIYPETRPDLALRALALGANEVVAETAGIAEIELRIKRMLARKHIRDILRKSDETSYRLAATDPLTGLYNRRYAEAYLSDLTTRSASISTELCLVLIDIDHFKSVNDTYGHVAGDAVLCEVADRLQSNLRAFDLVSRFGGEEFLVILPETGREEAAIMSERLRAAVAATPFRLPDCEQVNVTASIGVAVSAVCPRITGRKTGTYDVVHDTGFGSFLPVLEAADSALYRAKETGRNRVEFSAA